MTVAVTTALLSVFISVMTTFALKVFYPSDWAIFKKEVVGPHKYNNPLIFRFSKSYYGANTEFNPVITNKFLKLRGLLAQGFLLNEKIWKVSTTIGCILVAIFFIIFNICPEVLDK